MAEIGTDTKDISTYQQFLRELYQIFGLIGQFVHVSGPPLRHRWSRREQGQLSQ